MGRAAALGLDPDVYCRAGWLDRIRLEATYTAAEQMLEQRRRATVIDTGRGIFGRDVTYTTSSD
jgi:hypothetical protein